jgi:hypothetical protein
LSLIAFLKAASKRVWQTMVTHRLPSRQSYRGRLYYLGISNTEREGQMTKPYKRHQKKRREAYLRLGQSLSSLAERNRERFLQEWSTRVTSWLEEIERRGRRMSRGVRSTDSHLHVFAVYDDVEFLLLEFSLLDRLVGRQTRSLLRAACARAVASSADARMYRLVTSYRTIRN